MVPKQFGDQVRAEVVNDLMRSSFAQAVTQEKLRPAGGPRIEPIALGPGSDLKYAAHFEVMPEVRSPARGDRGRAPAATVTEADIDAMIENMRAQRPVFTAVERPARTGDRVMIDYQARIGGKPFEGGELSDVPIVIGSRQAMPELEEGLKGPAPASSAPSASCSRRAPEQAGRRPAAELQLTIKAVEEQSLPAVDEEFCRAYGVEEGGLMRCARKSAQAWSESWPR